MIRTLLPWVLLAVTPTGCYLKARQSDAPLTAASGVTVGLVGEDCEDRVGSEGDPVSRSMRVKLKISNPTPAPLDFSPGAVSLTVDADTVLAAAGPASVVAAGEDREVELRFLFHAACNQEFTLGFDRAFPHASPEALRLHFTPY